ncbi:unnamed protein product [Cochlearia groenlandica]
MAEGMRSRSNGLNERLEALEAVAAVRNAQIGDMVEALRLMNMMNSSNVERYDLGKSDLQRCLDRLEVSIREKEKTIELKMKSEDSSSQIHEKEHRDISKEFVLDLDHVHPQQSIVAQEEEDISNESIHHLQVPILDLESSHKGLLGLFGMNGFDGGKILTPSVSVAKPFQNVASFSSEVSKNSRHVVIGGSMHSYAHQVFDEMFMRGRRNKEHDKTKFPKSWRFRYKLGRKKTQRWHIFSPCLAMFCELQVARFQNKKKRWSLKFHLRHKWRSKHHLHEAEMTRLDNRSLEHLLESRLFEYKEKLCKRWLRFSSRSLKLFRLHTFLFQVKHKWRFKFNILLLWFEEQADERMFTRHILCCLCFQLSKGYNSLGLIVFWRQVVEPTNGRAQLHSDLELSSWFIKKKSHLCSITKTKWKQKSDCASDAVLWSLYK